MISNKTVLGIVAHVDAGKTTLSEAIMYTTGMIRKIGRVDNKDAFLDTYALERERGITIFSKQAEFQVNGRDMTLLDTPGHVDFSAEMERTLQALDYAILVVSAADGVQGHTRTLWRLLKQYRIPTFIFVNKMDQKGANKQRLLEELKNKLDANCIDFTEEYRLHDEEEFFDSIAMCHESLMDEFLETGAIDKESIVDSIENRNVYPCLFGSALKLEGVDALLNLITEYTNQKEYPDEFGAKVFKILRNVQNERLTYMKVTGGILKTKMPLGEEKVNQIRIYSGTKFQIVSEATAGTICAVTGLTSTHPGDGLGIESASGMPLLEPVLTYQISLPNGEDPAVVLPKLRQLEEEEPELHIVWNEKLQEIQIQLMGEVQIEVIQSLILQRYQLHVVFGQGHIVYKETIANTVEGVGHFEPLRHYAEVHLLLEPGEPGSGITIGTDCSEDKLDKNWQRLIVTHLYEKEYHGVLTNAPITDMKITLIAGRAHMKHTEGGDFRQATYRAVRQGLMKAESVLLEPFYSYMLELPTQCVGRAMTDMERMFGTAALEESDGEMAIIKGSVPVVALGDYQREVHSYTKGLGKLTCTLKGYEPCHNAEEIIVNKGYDAELDANNPCGSVFCAHGAGFTVSWDQVEDYMHVESAFGYEQRLARSGADATGDKPKRTMSAAESARTVSDEWIGVDEVDAILRQTYGANKKDKDGTKKWSKHRSGTDIMRLSGSYASVTRGGEYKPNKPVEKRKKYLLVDGYNVIFAWQSLNEMAAVNIDSARGVLLDTMCEYQALADCELIVVFDAYRVKGHPTEYSDYHNIHVVYTKEAETADQYIEKFAHENGRKYDVTVATSDGLEQIIIRGQGCTLISSREFEKEVERRKAQLRTDYLEQQVRDKIVLGDTDVWEQLNGKEADSE